MTTLYDALLDTARLCGILKSGQATSTGASNYVVDTNRYEADDYFNNGTIFIRSGTYIGQTARVLDYTQSNGYISVDPTGSANFEYVNAGVYYSITNENREALAQAINQALFDMGEYTALDDTLTVVANQQEYTLPAGVSNVKRISIANYADDPVEYHRAYHWQEIAGKIYISETIMQPTGNIIRLHYLKRHPEVNADTDVIQGGIDTTWLAWAATYYFLRTRLQYSGNTDEREQMLLQEAQAKHEKYSRLSLNSRLERDANLARW
jgi:hypothetical protein